MSREEERLEAVKAYRRALWKLAAHALFVGSCVVFAVVIRRTFKLPSAMLGLALIAALILFSGDIMRFLRARERLKDFD
jgi:hypothetical protein